MIRRAFCAAMLVLAIFLADGQARAQQLIDTPAQHAFMLDATTGTVLLEKAADVPMPPASMSKLMTAFMVFERLEAGHLTMDDTLPVSERAWRKGGSKMFVELGSRVRLEDLLQGVIVQSGNDACIVIAEGLAGSEEAFAEEMNRRGREIGLTGSLFKNATGWPDEGHLMTARDLAHLAGLIVKRFPQYYHFYSQTSFTYNDIRQPNRNPLLYQDMGADGLKTGYTTASGYGLTASAERDGRRLILVLNGLDSAAQRAREAERLMEWGFRAFGSYALFRAGETVEDAAVWMGAATHVPLVLERDLSVTLQRTARRDMEVTVRYDGPIAAPVLRGDRIGTVTVSAPGIDPIERALMAGEDVGRLGPIGRIVAGVTGLVGRVLP